MFDKIRRALKGAASLPDTAFGSPPTRTRYHWRCACGAHSRSPGGLIPSEAEYLAQRHLLSKRVGHSKPELYSTEEELA